MARLNWSKSKARKRMTRRGIESIRGDMPIALPKQRGRYRRPPSKAEMRTHTANLIAQFRDAITAPPTIIDLKCLCGHRGTARVARDERQQRFRCAKCGVSQLWTRLREHEGEMP
jgi:hypothetical protein